MSKSCPGFPRARMSEVFGPPGCGKTTLMLASASEVTKFDGTVWYIDTMAQLSPAIPGVVRASEVGTFLIMNAGSVGELEQPILNAIAGNVDLVIVDALSALGGAARRERDATFVRTVNALMRRLTAALSGTNTAVVFVNTVMSRFVTEDLSSNANAPEPHPEGLGFTSHMYRRLRLAGGSDAIVDGVQEITATLVKDAMSASQGKSARYKVQGGLILNPATKQREPKRVTAPSRFDREDPI